MRDPGGPNPYLDKLRSVGFAASAMPSRASGAAAKTVNDREDRWNADMPAYKRLRKAGDQPPRIDGAAARERAIDQSA